MNKDILLVVDAVSNEKDVDKEVIFEAIEKMQQVDIEIEEKKMELTQ